jgi:hypothetical protein
VKEILTEFEASMIKKIKENLGVDIRGDTTFIKNPILLILIGHLLLLIFTYLILSSLVEKIIGALENM